LRGLRAAETVLLQLIRGAGLPGLAAMPEAAPFAGGRLLRPLLPVPRALLQQFLEQNDVRWSDDPSRYLASALSPARINEVRLDEDNRSATVIVPDSQQSLAIGKEGQNVRLAARLTGWRIDIRSESQMREIDAIEQPEFEGE
jgi:tRNA(Ile)-lysidine synthase TilS/MesJ